MKAKITLTYASIQEAEAVAKAISPDNVSTPPGLTVKTTREKTQVVTIVECQTRLETFLATIDDLLSCVSTAESTFPAAQMALRSPANSE